MSGWYLVACFLHMLHDGGTIFNQSEWRHGGEAMMRLTQHMLAVAGFCGGVFLLSASCRAYAQDEGPPVITQHPADRTVTEPNPATFFVTAVGALPLSYQWRRDAEPIAGATSGSYVLSSTVAQEDDGAQFDCVASNPQGSVTSSVAVLTVNAEVHEPPSIDVGPQDVTVMEPSAVLFTVAAHGSHPLYYKWFRNGARIIGATGASYLLTPTSTSDSGAIFVVSVSNTYGVAVSTGAVLTVTEYVPQPPSITTQPHDLTVEEPYAAVFAVVATGHAPLTYQWRRDGVAILGAKSSAYILNPTSAAKDNGATFDVLVSNAIGGVTSQVAVLTVTEKVPIPPTITIHPQSASVLEPDEVQFSVVAAGDPPLSYQWRRDGSSVFDANGTMFVISPTENETDNGALIDVIVSSPYGSVTSDVAVLTVVGTNVPPFIDMQPDDLTITEPEGAGFAVVALGSEPLAYQWRRDGTNIAGANFSAYIISWTEYETHDGARFDVVVSNLFGSVISRAATLTVNPLPPPGPPIIHGDPASVTVLEPAAAGFSVLVGGVGPISYRWRRNGTVMPGQVASAYVVSPTAMSDNGAVFDCIVNNPYGSVTSQVAVLTVLLAQPPVPPYIGVSPANQSVVAPAPAGFAILAGGQEPLIYQWRRDGTNINGAIVSAYVLSATLLNDSGARFDCVVSNPYGSVTSGVAVLSVSAPVIYPPVISRQPVNVAVVAPAAAAFSVAATGDAPLNYQWQRNGTNIVNAIFTDYLVPSTALSDNGTRFDCVVGNPYGTVTSVVAMLNVTLPNLNPPQLAPLSNRQAQIGHLLTFPLAATDPDAQIPALSMPVAPTNATFVDHGDGTATFSWTPGVADLGSNTVQFTANDGVFAASSNIVITVTSFEVTRPAAGAAFHAGDPIQVAWTGQWSLVAVDIDVWQGATWVRELTNSAPSPAPGMSLDLTLPQDLSAGADYKVRVTVSATPGHFAESTSFMLLSQGLPWISLLLD